MTTWVLSFGWNWLLVPVLVWFLNGLRKATLNQRTRLVSAHEAGGVLRLEIDRQEMLPPWRTVRETWITSKLEMHEAWTRLSDGWRPRSGYSYMQHWLQDRLDCLWRLSVNEKKHTDAVLGDSK